MMRNRARLRLILNIKSHARFRFVLQSTILDDFEWHQHNVLHKVCVFQSSPQKFKRVIEQFDMTVDVPELVFEPPCIVVMHLDPGVINHMIHHTISCEYVRLCGQYLSRCCK